MLSLAALPLVSGCGRDVSGTYKGNESVQQSSALSAGGMVNGAYQGYGTAYTNTSVPMTTQSSSLTITIAQTNGENISGTYQSISYGSGTMTGRKNANGDDQITVTLSMPQAAAVVPNPAAYNGAAGATGATAQPTTTQCPGTYTGTLTMVDGKRLTGVLTANSSNPYCNGSRSIDVTK